MHVRINRIVDGGGRRGSTNASIMLPNAGKQNRIVDGGGRRGSTNASIMLPNACKKQWNR